MQYFRRKLILDLFKLSDIFILLISLIISSLYMMKEVKILSFSGFLHLQVEVINIIGFLLLIILWHSMFNHFHLYQSRRIGSRYKEIIDIIKAITTVTLCMALAGKVFSIDSIVFRFIAVFWLSSITITLLFRTFLRYFLNIVRIYGRNLRFVLIIGTNQRACDFAKKIEGKKELGYRIVGYIDNMNYKNEKDINILGTLKDFPDILRNHIVDEVVICLPIKSFYDEIQEVVKRAEEQGIVIRYLSHLFDTKVSKPHTGSLEGYSVMTMTSGPQMGWQLMMKRFLDLVLSVVLIILTSPIMLFAAVAIKLNSPGPVLFIQERIGYNKRIFRCYKFRTMVMNAEKLQEGLESQNEMDGPVFKIKNDSRITKTGKWLRKLSIDELPQIFNVIRGDMSMVGPRPLPLRDFNKFQEDWLHRRSSVLPGITCTWQINGRSDINFEEWVKMDMRYIDNWNLFEDFKILIKTIPAVIKGEGAA